MSTKKNLNELAKLARKIDPARLEMALNKTDSIRIRVTPAEKEEIKRAAAKYGTTISDYLLQLHRLAGQKPRK